ncbi:MAG: hypothetical protein JXR63_00740 [Spirochaetales bacterium]|nr:hypothetical protein [Spirochaetales bacterium]
MKKTCKKILLGLLLATIVAACGEIDLENKPFYSTGKTILPSYDGDLEAIAAKLQSRNTEWNYGNAIYELHALLVDDADYEGKGYFNIFDTLRSADELYKSASSIIGSTISKAVASPIDFGFETQTYTKYYIYENSDNTYVRQVFLKETETNVDILCLTTINREGTTSGSKNKSVTQATYNKSSGDVEFGMFMANYVDTSWEVVKAYAEGNVNTFTFTTKILRSAAGYSHNIIGKGVSSETGYFLLKLANNSTDIADGKFYKINSNADVAALQALDIAGFETAELAGDSTGYAAGLPSAYTMETDMLTQQQVQDLVLTVTME